MKPWSLAVGCFLVGGLVGSHFVSSISLGQVKPAQPPAIPRELTSYRDIVKRVLPAVVSLDANAKSQPKNGQPGGELQPMQKPGEPPKAGFGSGVIVDARGVVLTSFHVVEGAESVVVSLLDGRQFISRDIRGDRRTDLAIVVLDKSAGTLPFLSLGDSDGMEIGDRVLAVGAPFGLTGSVTHGIISGKERSGLNLNMYEDFLQTDAAINPGNSGGPLISLDGKVIAINAAIKSKTGGFQGVGLAVASNLCKSVVQALVTEGVVRRGYLGLNSRELSAEMASKLGLSKQGGVVVAEVFEKTPAAKAGLRAGDVLVTIAGKAVTDTKALQTIVMSLPLNKPALVSFVRDGKRLSVNVTIEQQPDDFGVPRTPGLE